MNGELEKRRAAQPEKPDGKATESGATKDSTEDAPEEEKTVTTTEETPDFDKERIDISNFSFSLNPDAFSGQVPETDSDKEELANDEQDVRLACEFLRATVLPELISDLKEGDVGFPMDGQSLSRLLHKRGINIRYLGKLAVLAEGKRLESLRALTLQEMISRAFKHVVSKYLRYLPTPLTASCIAHLLNCLVGTGLNAKPKADVDSSMAALYPEVSLDFQNVSPESLRQEIEGEILRRYQYAIESAWATNIKPVQLLREVSLKLGLHKLKSIE